MLRVEDVWGARKRRQSLRDIQCVGCKVKERDGMMTKGQAGVKESYFKMGDIWRVYKQKGGTQGRKDWRSKTERQGSQKHRVWKGLQAQTRGRKADKQKYRGILRRRKVGCSLGVRRRQSSVG